MPPLSAAVVCYNNAPTIGATLASIRSQTIAIDDLLVVDDGSTDGSAEVAERFGARVIRHAANLGRGAARACAIIEARHDAVLCIDATGTVHPGFVAHMLPWFDDRTVAAVCSRVDDPDPAGLARRWRARHLFRTRARVGVSRRASLITGGSLLRRAAVLEAGNFDPSRRFGEDAELGQRLLARGYDVVQDPRVCLTSTAANSVVQVLERYARWHSALDEAPSWRAYLRHVAYSIKVMAREDLSEGDPAAAAISLVAPHFQAWHMLRRQQRRRGGAA